MTKKCQHDCSSYYNLVCLTVKQPVHTTPHQARNFTLSQVDGVDCVYDDVGVDGRCGGVGESGNGGNGRDGGDGG